MINELRSASEALVASLHAEAEFGEKALAAEPRDSMLPESLRATAVRRGEQANALAARELALLPK